MTQIPKHRVATHPGVLLLEQIRDIKLSVHEVARECDLPPTRLHEIVHELIRELLLNGDRIRARVRPHAEP